MEPDVEMKMEETDEIMSEKCEAIYNRYLEIVGGDLMVMQYSHAHIVWADHNLDDHSIAFCLRNRKKHEDSSDCFCTKWQLDRVDESLWDLLEIPESERLVEVKRMVEFTYAKA